MEGTLIDHFYCSSPEKVISSYIRPLPLYIKLKNFNLIKNYTTNKNIYIKDFSRIKGNNNWCYSSLQKTWNRQNNKI